MIGIFTADRSASNELVLHVESDDGFLTSVVPDITLFRNLGPTLFYFIQDGCAEIRGDKRG